jgi:hypothetical protein
MFWSVDLGWTLPQNHIAAGVTGIYSRGCPGMDTRWTTLVQALRPHLQLRGIFTDITLSTAQQLDSHAIG